MIRKYALFAGPSLPDDVKVPDYVDIFPPIKSGDIYELLNCGYSLIAIIDGLFHGVPSIWHREILAAMDENISIWGSSSMGALRASELHSFGMNGIGHVFEWYSQGLIDGDDEVALHHLADPPYKALTIPLVDIRHILQAKLNLKIGSDEHELIIGIARKIPYWDRTVKSFQDHLNMSNIDSNLVCMLVANLCNIDSVKKIDASFLLEKISSADTLFSQNLFELPRYAFKRTSLVDLYANIPLEVRKSYPVPTDQNYNISAFISNASSTSVSNSCLHAFLSFWFESQDDNIVLHNQAADYAYSKCGNLLEILHSASSPIDTFLTRNEIVHMLYLSSYFHELACHSLTHLSDEYYKLADCYIKNSTEPGPLRPVFFNFSNYNALNFPPLTLIAFEIMFVSQAFQAFGLDLSHLVDLHKSFFRNSVIDMLPGTLQEYIIVRSFGIEILGCYEVIQISHHVRYLHFCEMLERCGL